MLGTIESIYIINNEYKCSNEQHIICYNPGSFIHHYWSDRLWIGGSRWELEAVLGVRTFRGGRGGVRGRVCDLDMDCNQEEISALISGRLTYICVPAWRLKLIKCFNWRISVRLIPEFRVTQSIHCMTKIHYLGADLGLTSAYDFGLVL